MEILDYYPDLVHAVGMDGTVGFVRSIELLAYTPRTFHDTERLGHYQAAGVTTASIPLYEADGMTIIGMFEYSFIGET